MPRRIGSAQGMEKGADHGQTKSELALRPRR